MVSFLFYGVLQFSHIATTNLGIFRGIGLPPAEFGILGPEGEIRGDSAPDGGAGARVFAQAGICEILGPNEVGKPVKMRQIPPGGDTVVVVSVVVVSVAVVHHRQHHHHNRRRHHPCPATIVAITVLNTTIIAAVATIGIPRWNPIRIRFLQEAIVVQFFMLTTYDFRTIY